MFCINRKAISLLIIIILSLSLAAGCNKTEPTPAAKPPVQTASQTTAPASQGAETASNTQQKKDSGSYQGQIDNNSIEIKVSGVPDNLAYKAFQLSEPLKGNFSKLGLKKDDQVRFTYTERAGEQPLLTEISKIVN